MPDSGTTSRVSACAECCLFEAGKKHKHSSESTMDYTTALSRTKLLSGFLAFCGIFLAVFGIAYTHTDCDTYSKCERYSYEWWVLGMEILCLCFFGVMEKMELGKSLYVPAVGFFVVASTSLDTSADRMLRIGTAESKSGGAGLVILLAVNVTLTAITGLENYVAPKCPFVVECDEEKTGKEKGESDQKECPYARKFEVVRRFVGLGLAGVGFGGSVIAAIAFEEGCDTQDCVGDVRNNFFWWVIALEFFTLLVFVTSEILLELQFFRPFVAFLLSIHLPYMATFADSSLWKQPSSWDWSYRKLQFVGFTTLASVNFLMLLALHTGPTFNVDKEAKRGSSALPIALVPTVAGITGFVFVHVRDESSRDWEGIAWWNFSLEIVVLLGVLACLHPKNPLSTVFRLPLVATIAIATTHPMVQVHNWIRGDDLDCAGACDSNFMNGVGYFLIALAHILLILMMGSECPNLRRKSPEAFEHSIGAKVRRLIPRVRKLPVEGQEGKTAPLANTADDSNGLIGKDTRSDVE